VAISAAPLLPGSGYPPFEILYTGNPPTIHLAGELDLVSGQLVGDMLLALETDGVTPVVVDLSDVTFLDCSGLSVLVRAYNRASRSDREVFVTNPREAVRRIFRLTGCSYLLGDPDRETLEA
jgi:anti-anti-sigma factor